jgi:hypothetical protein
MGERDKSYVRKLYLQYDTFLSDVGIEDSANKGSFLL